jgi:hypothetical protein
MGFQYPTLDEPQNINFSNMNDNFNTAKIKNLYENEPNNFAHHYLNINEPNNIPIFDNIENNGAVKNNIFNKNNVSNQNLAISQAKNTDKSLIDWGADDESHFNPPIIKESSMTTEKNKEIFRNTEKAINIDFNLNFAEKTNNQISDREINGQNKIKNDDSKRLKEITISNNLSHDIFESPVKFFFKIIIANFFRKILRL